MPTVLLRTDKPSDFFVDHEKKVFEDVRTEASAKALVTFHTGAFEGSIGRVQNATTNLR